MDQNPQKQGRANRIQSTNEVFQGNSLLKKYFEVAKHYDNNHRRIFPHIPIELHDKVRIRALDKNVLVLEAQSAAVATRIRQLSDRLLKSFKTDQQLENIRWIDCKVAMFSK